MRDHYDFTNAVRNPYAARLKKPMKPPAIETDLTEEERAIIRAGREECKAGKYVPLEEIENKPDA